MSVSGERKSPLDEAQALVWKEFADLLLGAKADVHQFVKDNAGKVEKWAVMLATGQLTRRDFDLLVAEQRAKIQQFLNTVQIEQKARLERLTVGLLDILTNKLLDALLSLVPK